MTRQQAIDFINESVSDDFRYGDLSYTTGRADALDDIYNMSDEEWNDGVVMEA